MTNILAGIVLFEVFHDVQYLSIVWTNQTTPISAADQRVIDGFVAQQTKALAATS